MLPPPILRATIAHPVIIYYCKAGIQTGTTIRVLHRGQVHACRGVHLHGCDAGMFHDNSTGKPKASGARCVMTVTTGLVGLEYPHDTEPFHLEEAAAIALECDLLIFFEEAGEENLYYRDIFQRRYYCKPGGQSLNGHKLLCWP
jgi:hypothetical protein